jgi:hypothetical protein
MKLLLMLKSVFFILLSFHFAKSNSFKWFFFLYFSLYKAINDPPPPYSETWEHIKIMKIMLGIKSFYMLCIENLPKIKSIYKVKYSSEYRE